MADDMRPCPFCGSEHVVLEGIEFHWVKCAACSAEGPVHKDEYEAVRRWNERVSRADVLASAGAEFRAVAATVGPDGCSPKESPLNVQVETESMHSATFYVDPETAARIVMAKGLRLLLVEGGE